MNKTQEQLDFEAMRDFWIWESMNGSGYKTEWPEFRRIQNLYSLCAFCHYKSSFSCLSCFLYKKLNKPCASASSFYRRWKIAKTKKTKMRHAKTIADVCIEYCEERWGKV